MAAASPGAPPGHFFYGWTVVTAAGLILFMAYGTQYAFGVFFAALVEEFGWSRASVSGIFSLYAAVYSGFALMAGRLTDRWVAPASPLRPRHTPPAADGGPQGPRLNRNAHVD